MFYLYSTDEENIPVLFIEGRLNSVDEIEKLIAQKLTSNSNDREYQKDQLIIIDLSKTEFISEKCFRAFQHIGLKNKIEFRNYSLYIGMQLNEYKLLT